MIQRDIYLTQLLSFKDKEVVKVITGIRRCGKSTLLSMFGDCLRQNGVPDDRIIFINLESALYDNIRNYHELYTFISEKISSAGRYYVMIDEIQQVNGFEKAVESLRIDHDVDIYLTGSNAYMLSSELATLLSGRYVEIKMLPLSFAEYAAQSKEDIETVFYRYMKYGGFPFLAEETNESVIGNYLDGIYNTVVLKDVIKKNNIKDIALLEKILKTVLSSIGSIVSSNSITNTLKSNGNKVSNETVEKYLDMFCKAFILQKAERYDIKGKEYLKTLCKYYVSDIGLRNHILGYRQIEITHALENTVYLELIRRGYQVDIGKVNTSEIDFIARKKDRVEYYQVAFSVNQSQETLQRELKPFDAVDNHYQKFLLTMDRDFVTDFNGIRKLYVVDWLLGK